MKPINDLADMLDKWANKLDERAEKGLEKTAEQIYQDIVGLAPMGATGNYISSIRIYPMEKKNDELSIFIGSDLMVGPTKSKGKSYNLGYLLEHGTNPHDIYPVDSEFLVFPVIDKETGKEKTIFTKHVWHPGTTAQPHYSLAIEKNKKFFRDNIMKEVTWR